MREALSELPEQPPSQIIRVKAESCMGDGDSNLFDQLSLAVAAGEMYFSRVTPCAR